MRFPRPLAHGDLVAVTAPSSGVLPELWGRLEAGVDALRERGYGVRLGDCLGTPSHVSAPARQRADELTTMLIDPEVKAVVPPWGGELGTDLLDLLDWEAIAAAEPTWVVGYSDTTTVMLPLTLLAGWATVHGGSLMESRYDPPAGLAHWADVAAATETVSQTSPGRFRAHGRDDWAADPGVRAVTLDSAGTWSTLAGGEAAFSGRLIGGCLETLSVIASSQYGDVPKFAAENAPVVVLLDIAESDAFTIARMLHGVRHAGWFDRASGVLVSRTHAPDSGEFRQRDAVVDALGRLDIPVVLDVECGHVQPSMPLVIGAPTEVSWRGGVGRVSQQWQ